VPVLEKPLEARHGGGDLGLGNGNFVHHGGLSIPQDGLPALAGARGHEFDQLGLRL